MRLLVVAFALVLVFFGTGCSKSDGGGGGAQTLAGDMTGATSLAVTKPAPGGVAMGSFFGAATPSPTPEPAPFSTLVKIDENGVPSPVFNQQREIFGVILSPNHVVVAGSFTSVRVRVEGEEEEQGIDCYLVAFPRTATGEAVKCLSQRPTGVFREHLEGGFPHDNMPLGFSVRGEDFYFTDAPLLNGPFVQDSHVWRWAGGADEVELLLLFAPEATKFASAHTVDGAGQVCVQTLADVNWEVLCSPVDTINWQPAAATSTTPSWSLVLGTNLLLAGSVVHLSDGTVTSPTNANIPPGRRVTVPYGNEAYGVSNNCPGGVGCIVHLFSDGTIDILGETSPGSGVSAVDWERILGAGDVAYVYGESNLRRLDMAAAVLGTTNLLGSTSLLNVTDMSLSTSPLIRLDGTTSAGLPSIVLINTSSGEITVTEEDVPRFVSVTPLD